METSVTSQDWILIIGAIGILVNNAINNWRQSAKIDTIVTTAKVIEGHANSAGTLARAEKEAGIAREAKLQETIDELKKSAALLAQAAAIQAISTDKEQGKKNV